MKYLIRLILMIAIIVVLDVYTFQAIKTVTKDLVWGKWAKIGYWVVHGLFYGWVMVSMVMGIMRVKVPSWVFAWTVSLFVVLYLPKFVVAIFMLIEDIVRLVRWAIGKMSGGGGAGGGESLPGNKISRSKFLSMTGLAVAGIPFASALWGVIRTKYDYSVKRFTVPVKNLPEAFEGFTITQISDVHSGSFDSFNSVKRGIEMVNEQKSDVIFFTGDLVNNVRDELKEFKELYGTLTAKDGIYSVLGNHDYGDYVGWPSKAEKQANLDGLIQDHKDMGWNILMNESRILERNGQKLAILGVENWSALGQFPKYGKLNEAYAGTEDVPTKILLSHDPTHWDAQIRPEYPDIDLTLSGHTHGAQFGIEIPGFRWSPVQYMYKQWAGLYSEGDQHLYVNRGFGFLGFSGRIGIKPEITVLELTRA